MNEDLKKKINEHYQLGQGSIQDIARTYRLTVEEVLETIGQTDVSEVTGIGDLIGPEDAGPEVNIVAEKKYKANFSTN